MVGKFLAAIVSATLFIIACFWVGADLREFEEPGTFPFQGGRFVDTELGRAFVLERGEPRKYPVIFTHGTAAWSGLWLPTLEHVGKNGYLATGFDMPPFGYSEHAHDGNYGRQIQARRFLALLKTYERPPIVVAHSFSGGMVAEAAMMNSDLFAAIVFVDAAIGLNSHIEPVSAPYPLKFGLVRKAAAVVTTSNPYLTKFFLRQFVHKKESVSPAAIATLKQPMSRKGYTEAVSNWLPQLLQSPENALSTREKNWRKLDLPVSFIWGDQDTITPLSQAETLQALLPNADLKVMAGVGHIPQIEAPKAFQAELVQTLRDLKMRMKLRETK